MKPQLALWAPFVVMSALTLLVVQLLWQIPGYFPVLYVLAGLNLLCGIRVIARTWPKRWPIVVVIVGLIIGQWWLVLLTALVVGWSIVGFAP